MKSIGSVICIGKTPRDHDVHAPHGTPGLSILAVILISVVLSLSLQSLLTLRGFYASTFDESGRSLEAFLWSKDFSPFVGIWGPLYKIVVGIALLIFPDLIITPRIISCVFGAGVVIEVILLTESLFQNRAASLLGGILAAILPQRLILSAAPLAEIMFIFFIVAAIRYTVQWERTHLGSFLIKAAMAFAFSGMLRYEGWIFSLAFGGWCIMGFTRKQEVPFRFLAIVCAILALFPVSWILLYKVVFDHPFGFLTAVQTRYTRIHGNDFATLLSFNVVPQFFKQNITSGNIVGIASILFLARTYLAGRWFLVISGAALLILSCTMIITGSLPTHGYWRIAAVWSVLLIPWSALLLARCQESKRRALNMIGVFGFVLLVVLCGRESYTMSSTSALTKEQLAAGRYIGDRLALQPGDSVLIESRIMWDYVNVMIASQRPDLFIPNTGFDPMIQNNPCIDPDRPIEEDILRSRSIRYLVFRTDEYIEKFSRTDFLRPLAHIGFWFIYEVREDIVQHSPMPSWPQSGRRSAFR